jgi:hypothetical protein
MKRLFLGLLSGIGGYVVTAAVSYYLILQFSPNVHDRAIEAAMGSVFFFGPVGGLGAFAVGIILGGKRLKAPKAKSL